MAQPETRYAKSSDVHIAYQVLGKGPLDVVFVQGFISNLEVQWEDPGLAHLLNRLARLGRLILFDKRGSGLSDRVPDMPTMETRMDDVRAVMDAAHSRQAVLIGASEGGPLSILFAATYPQRTRALVLYGAYARFRSAVQSREQVEAFIESADQSWGTGASLRAFAPGMLDDPQFCAWWARFERLGATPAAIMQLARMNAEIDITEVLPAVRVPTLVAHRRDDVRVNVAAGRALSQAIEGARYVELEGADHPIWVGNTDAVVDAIEAFLTGSPPVEPDHRVLATVLCAIPASPAPHSDAAWIDAGEAAGAAIAAQFARFRGRVLAGGAGRFLAAFDGPTRAVRCALAVRNALGPAVRVGVHTGELEQRGQAMDGMALRIAAGIAEAARGGDVLVSGTVRDLMYGAPVAFAERGHCALEGVGHPIRLLAAIERPLQDAPVPASLAALSPREREVLRLVAHGLRNPEIAASLLLSEHTVKRHVANILLKLDLPTRSAAAALLAGER